MPDGARQLLFLLAALSLAGCDTLFGPPSGADTALLQALPRELSSDELRTIRAANGFAFDILRETVERDASPNVFLSPLSASMALGMTMNGARGETQDGMRRALGFGDLEMERVNAAYRDLIDLLLGLDPGVEMRVGNSIWARDGYPFHESFFRTAKEFFDAEVANLNFSDPGAAPTINDWVRAATAGRIEEIVPDAIPGNVHMYLINAIFFEGRWRHPFDAARTTDAPFRLADGGESRVRMMSRRGDVLHHHDPEAGARVAELLYGRGAFAMTIVLPDDAAGLDALIGSLDAQRWQAWTEALVEGETELGLPRFRLEYETTMNDALIALGMELAFGAPGTDFSGMTPADLHIGDVKQKTFLEVDEAGTVAAAATSVSMVDSAPPSFVVDRPFLLAIRERLSGAILFVGRVGAPESH